MTEQLIMPKHTAAEELSEIIFSPDDYGYKRIVFGTRKTQYAVEFRDFEKSLVAAVWKYDLKNYEPEILQGALKFTKDTDEIRVKYDSMFDNNLADFGEGRVADRECEPRDLDLFQPKIQKAISRISDG
jgi:hypothetical protein